MWEGITAITRITNLSQLSHSHLHCPLIYHCLPPAPVHDYDLGLACSIIKKWQTSLVPNRRTGHILESGWQHRLVRNRYQIQLSRIWSLLVYSLRCLVCLLYYVAWCLDYRPGPAFCFWSIIFTAKVTSLKTEILPSKCLLAPDVYTELRPKAKFLQSASCPPQSLRRLGQYMALRPRFPQENK